MFAVFGSWLAGNAGAWLKTLAGAVGYLGLCTVIRKLNLLPNKLSRKLMHIGTGPLYMLFWPLYSSSPWSPLICATVPLLASVHFALVGTGLMQDASLVKTATRSGDKGELLRGPLAYGLVHAAVAATLWRHSPDGLLALAVLCGGDGLAEVVGSSVPSSRLPYNKDKSVAGTLACLAGGLAFGLPLLWHFQGLGMLRPPSEAAAATLEGPSLVAGVALCSGVGALVESAMKTDLDNVAVVVAVAAAARLVFGF